MNKSERAELRSLLRNRFKVLRSDVVARKAELHAELDHQLAEKYAARDLEYERALGRLQEAVKEANRTANDIARELWGERWPTTYDKSLVQGTPPEKPGVHERSQERRNGINAIEARVQQALTELARQENELLTELAVAALETAEAKEFFGRIPNVADLVPAYRLAQLAGPGGNDKFRELS